MSTSQEQTWLVGFIRKTNHVPAGNLTSMASRQSALEHKTKLVALDYLLMEILGLIAT